MLIVRNVPRVHLPQDQALTGTLMEPDRRPIVVTGAAGLVGQNLIPRLKARHAGPLIAIDKHPANTGDPARLHPESRVIEADLAVDEAMAGGARRARTLRVSIMRRSAASTEAPFIANNVTATRNAARRREARGGVAYIVQVSSSVVNSAARDFYTETKKAQEQLVVASGIPAVRAAADADVRLVRPQASRLARALHGARAGVPGSRPRPLPAPAALRRRFLRHHRRPASSGARPGRPTTSPAWNGSTTST